MYLFAGFLKSSGAKLPQYAMLNASKIQEVKKDKTKPLIGEKAMDLVFESPIKAKDGDVLSLFFI